MARLRLDPVSIRWRAQVFAWLRVGEYQEMWDGSNERLPWSVSSTFVCPLGREHPTLPDAPLPRWQQVGVAEDFVVPRRPGHGVVLEVAIPRPFQENGRYVPRHADHSFSAMDLVVGRRTIPHLSDCAARGSGPGGSAPPALAKDATPRRWCGGWRGPR